MKHIIFLFTLGLLSNSALEAAKEAADKTRRSSSAGMPAEMIAAKHAAIELRKAIKREMIAKEKEFKDYMEKNLEDTRQARKDQRKAARQAKKETK